MRSLHTGIPLMHLDSLSTAATGLCCMGPPSIARRGPETIDVAANQAAGHKSTEAGAKDNEHHNAKVNFKVPVHSSKRIIAC